MITMAVGILKEIYDERSGKGTPDIRDLYADFLGIFIAFCAIELSYWVFDGNLYCWCCE